MRKLAFIAAAPPLERKPPVGRGSHREAPAPRIVLTVDGEVIPIPPTLMAVIRAEVERSAAAKALAGSVCPSCGGAAGSPPDGRKSWCLWRGHGR